jgi:hypothetical protein
VGANRLHCVAESVPVGNSIRRGTIALAKLFSAGLNQAGEPAADTEGEFPRSRA